MLNFKIGLKYTWKSQKYLDNSRASNFLQTHSQSYTKRHYTCWSINYLFIECIVSSVSFELNKVTKVQINRKFRVDMELRVDAQNDVEHIICIFKEWTV